MITSRTNPKIKRIDALRKKSKERRKEGVYLVEGIRMFREIPEGMLKEIYVSEDCCAKEKSYLEQIAGEIPLEILTNELYNHISDTVSPQGIMGIVRQEKKSVSDMLTGNPFLLLLERIQDPGNLGTMFRTAEAAGVSGIIMSPDCADIYNPKAIRSTMGSVFRVPHTYAEDFCGTLKELKKEGVEIHAAYVEDGVEYDTRDYTGSCGILLGNEGSGLSPEAVGIADGRIHIPMHGNVESLNVAICSSILIFEVARQRKKSYTISGDI